MLYTKNKIIAVLLLIAVMLMCSGCTSKQDELNNSSNLTAKSVTNLYFDNLDVREESGQIYQTYYATNHTIVVKGVVSPKNFPMTVRFSDENMKITFNPILVTIDTNDYVWISMPVSFKGNYWHDFTFKGALIDENGSVIKSSEKLTLNDKHGIDFDFGCPVEQFREIAGVEFEASYGKPYVILRRLII